MDPLNPALFQDQCLQRPCRQSAARFLKNGPERGGFFWVPCLAREVSELRGLLGVLLGPLERCGVQVQPVVDMCV